ncbi:hypothetical protein [Stutzerimonas stutzeri]|uniref:Uncharacterized protein n=1 Tax=Stutzerimonas stutzeri (strain A1501) TaxID=379731 RepID=A4VQ26_STUS1|nr:hypothetical protein [Stutzerimonas stutzeri]ABP81077.1 conserved hypothetical protein [Stutzerimonas stutzeri A1501]RRV84500.1 hypothetical protein EGI92_03575 [Stutzerimonas stutzeri]RRW49158.1 hypothetical protein EGJ42_12995 [Stutzerimonas stutzeri]UWG59847.1 hypothetical protein NDR94_17525 [Stutzerimonas stutzeri]
MTNSTSFTPTRRKPKQIKVFFVIDMWGIEGPYGDGKWHKLIHQFASEWASQNPAQEPATLWSVVRPCDIFENGTSCYMTSSTKLPGAFFDRLADFMEKHCGAHVQVLDVDFELPFGTIEGWRAYLHFEQGKLWLPDDEGGWCEAAD